jgi:bifunctional non-homologous end joining protein LigD
MSLEKYKAKREFNRTPEPTGGKPENKSLRFVVQKHHASHLHYDFRLELKGILKSWAVPKGLSMNPSENRLAMLVEDHPWDYRNFEGIIPSGYRKGTVIVWDEGTYETTVIIEKDKKSQEHSVMSQFWKGQIKFSLHGHKLKGAFQITRAKDKGDNAWYILKLKDKYATKEDITKKNKSVLSRKTLEQVAADPQVQWESHRPGNKEKPVTVNDISARIKAGSKSVMPSAISPMLCTLIKEPFNHGGWLYEVKWDGYQIIAFIKKAKVVLKSRGDQDYTTKYPPVAAAFKDLDYDAVIDGEVVVLDEKGNPDFSALQNYKVGDTIAFYGFDLLWCNGYNLMDLPLAARKELLKEIIPLNDIIKFSESFDGGIELFDTAKTMGIEGHCSKKKRQYIYTREKREYLV